MVCRRKMFRTTQERAPTLTKDRRFIMNAVIGISLAWVGIAIAFAGMFAHGGLAYSPKERRLWRLLGGSLITVGALVIYSGVIELASARGY